MRRKRLVLLGAAAMAAATALSGCVGFGGPGGAGGGQIDVIGDVDVTAGVCRSGTPGCISTNATTYPEVNMQLLAAFQIADAIAAPSTISITSGPQIGVFLDPSPSYSAELQRLAPAPAGSRWVGYISPAFTYRSAVEPASGTLLARFRLTQPGGQPVGASATRAWSARAAPWSAARPRFRRAVPSPAGAPSTRSTPSRAPTASRSAATGPGAASPAPATSA